MSSPSRFLLGTGEESNSELQSRDHDSHPLLVLESHVDGRELLQSMDLAIVRVRQLERLKFREREGVVLEEHLDRRRCITGRQTDPRELPALGLPPALVRDTTAVVFGTSPVPQAVVTLTEGVLSMMRFAHRKLIALGLVSVGLVAKGKTATGKVFEQEVRVGKTTCRSVVLRLNKPTADGDTEIRLLTNLSAKQASAAVVAEVYGRRWRIEGSFLELTTSVCCELDTLGYPKAALLGFAVAVCACNVLRVVCQALEEAQEEPAKNPPSEKTEETWEASSYAVAVELRTAYDGLVVNVPTQAWEKFSLWSASRFAEWLVGVAQKTDCRRYQKSKRAPKKPVERVKAGRKASHRSTFRLLEQRTKSPKHTRRP